MEPFLSGIDALLGRHARWIRGARLGLVSHQAAVDGQGCTAAERLRRDGRCRLVCLFGPEHGYLGAAAAGERCGDARHPDWGIPVYSLYGDRQGPAAEALRRLDALVFDLRDIGARPYTYCATLRRTLEAAAAAGKPVLVADRPIPLPLVTDGPVTEPAFESFVSAIPAPLSYGMTPGETARWLRAALGLDVELRVAAMRGYERTWPPRAGGRPPPWFPPSPAMLSWESALCYPATVAFEALAGWDYGRGGPLPFQVFGAPWLKGERTAASLNRLRLPGVRFHPHRYVRAQPPGGGVAAATDGVRLTVTDPARFRPGRTSVALLALLQRQYGVERVWAEGSRPEFFDRLWGTDAVRLGLARGDDAAAIVARWRSGLQRFRVQRAAALLYPEPEPRP